MLKWRLYDGLNIKLISSTAPKIHPSKMTHEALIAGNSGILGQKIINSFN